MLSEGDTARHLEYDCADRLRTFYVQTGAESSKYTHYLYDGGGNRVKKITRKQGGGYTATTYIDGTFEYTKESSELDAIPNLTIGTWVIGSYGSGEQNILHIMGFATRRIGDALGDSTPAVKYNLSDHLGSSTVQLDTNGTTVSLEEYYPFGETSFGSYAKKRYRFCGKEKDEESGLYYFGARYYSPWTCRFINIDPLADKYPFYSPYLYAGDSPINTIDVDGLGPADGGGSGATPTPSAGTVTSGSNAAASSENLGNGSTGPQPHIEVSSVYSLEQLTEGPIPETIVFSLDGKRIYNTASDRAWDYGELIEGYYELKKIDANTPADVSKDVTGTIDAVQGESRYVEPKVAEYLDTTPTYYKMLDPEAIHKRQEYTEQYWTRVFTPVSGPPTNDKYLFGVHIPATGNGIEPCNLDFEIILTIVSLGGVQLTKQLFQQGVKGLGRVGIKEAPVLVEAGTSNGGAKLLTESFSRFSRFDHHFRKHASEWVGITKEAYYKRALSLLEGPTGGNIQGFTNSAGYTFRMNMSTGEFGVMRPNGIIETFYRRLDNPAEYWAAQIIKYNK
jgi:RHS repeat-associated protein